MSNPREEITFLMVKPDGVKRGLTGEIIRRLEQVGLKIVALELQKPSRKQVDDHYPKAPNWIHRLGEKTLATYEKFGFDAVKELGTKDAGKIGIMVRKWLIDFMTSAPVVIMAIKGVHAVAMVRKLAGNTMPSDAPLGTIRGDFSVDSAAAANREKRAVFNLVHASETEEEAIHEIKHWFGKSVIHDYDRTDDEVFK
ncbi:MAG: nucleoside-diphosphate kinase [Candidatus Doudnabacteria bacterium RIFCSPHIGHO2_02_FULL_48_21]|uniref:nucleoside-diphosphate kinase n=1 Tax=Candidatus Doudnabacteria bacterium RIFCSPLOWO2_02_FULL_48_13 TaxID=1817845 RepID=A0A1F5Q9F9_9BACT|nr:MAG: nucleoside-diphosphate kinase [Candidatus Doudnabacteria bacterium RIFCSPHIGHO2_01_48_18]OGE79849.1 MAG: nucleoside-diphosphate kinase [Candidatus Doudnabacteria bacterium RIFCSPHIGHO2_01_FULL_48_180]OGE91388.1 MAG: nucleoside-diphosphate kinase [Candidatus Doudnabacteria bacterium RIFCSPHIGHO2_12_FULL_47_25]OGE93200.1 MAG: nucleoside-diphosphate kinase [Candidatus Doudnabacteria bacterium RIFCSPHIGHO2_02_FULL_48_21]OGE96721.1 MAG: nucleoside-diphosphate kinase [Candidatus Doudnabacteri